jgi:hypothetical protein
MAAGVVDEAVGGDLGVAEGSMTVPKSEGDIVKEINWER